jgi:hypothetical protein
MDRRIRMSMGGVAALMAGGLLLCSTGCRSTRSEVPAGKPYQTNGGAPPTVGFSQEPHPTTANGMGNLYGNRGPGAMAQDGMASSGGQGATVYGTPTPGTSLGLPTANQFGPPGTSGTGGSAQGGTGPLTNSLLSAQPPVSQVLARDPGSPSTIPGSNGGPGGSYP